MKNKIFWLSILGLALARPPSPIDYTASNIGVQQKQRTSRSIWPFTSSEASTTTEAPISYSPPLSQNNDWFLQGETSLPQGIDFNKYPVWKVHKYNGIDLRPVNLQPENSYPPEFQPTIEQGHSSGSSSSSDFHQNTYHNGYQDLPSPGGQYDLQSQSLHGSYATGYATAHSSPPATYPDELESYQTGEFHSSSFSPENNRFNIQRQQKYEVYSPPQPLKDFRLTANSVGPEPQKISSGSYGLPNAYQAGSNSYQGYNQAGQSQLHSGGDGQSQSSGGDKPDLSFLDDLGGLAPFLPEPTSDVESPRQEAETNISQQGFFENLFSRLRGSTDSPADESSINADEESATANSGGFFSSVFGLSSNSESPETEPSGTESSGSAFSSLFYPSQTESPGEVPTTYYLPKTRGSYIAVKVPPNAAPSFTPSGESYKDVSNIAFHQIPSVPFTQHEIPYIPSPTLDSGYPHNLGYSEVKNSGFNGLTISSDHQSSVVPQYHAQPFLPVASKIAPPFRQSYGSYQQSDFQVDDQFSSNHGGALDGPHAEYLYSGNNDQANGVFLPLSQTTPETKYHRGQHQSQDLPYSGRHQSQSTVAGPPIEAELPTSYTNTITLSNADESNYNQNGDGRSQRSQYQSFDTTNSNFQGTSNEQDTFERDRESVAFGQIVQDDKPIPAPQISEGFISSLPIEADDQRNFEHNNPRNNQETTVTGASNANGHSFDDNGDTLTQNFDSNPVLSHDPLPQKETELTQTSVPVYQTLISSLQGPSDTQEPAKTYQILPVNEANDFHETYSDQKDEDGDFITNLSALTSYGTPVNSQNSNPFAPTSSNIRSITIPAPTKDEIDNGSNINGISSTSPGQLPRKNAGRIIRKVIKRRNLVERNHARRSTPQRQAPTEEARTTLIIRSETDSIPEVRSSRQFYGTEVVDGYSKVHHQEHQVDGGTTRATKSVNPVLEAVQE